MVAIYLSGCSFKLAAKAVPDISILSGEGQRRRSSGSVMLEILREGVKKVKRDNRVVSNCQS